MVVADDWLLMDVTCHSVMGARAGRWNHTAWSRLAPMNTSVWRSGGTSPAGCAARTAVTVDVSEASASAQACMTSPSPTDGSTRTQVSARPVPNVTGTCRRSSIQPQPVSVRSSGFGTPVGAVTVCTSGASSGVWNDASRVRIAP